MGDRWVENQINPKMLAGGRKSGRVFFANTFMFHNLVRKPLDPKTIIGTP